MPKYGHKGKQRRDHCRVIEGIPWWPRTGPVLEVSGSETLVPPGV